jgi:hypothetical protein
MDYKPTGPYDVWAHPLALTLRPVPLSATGKPIWFPDFKMLMIQKLINFLFNIYIFDPLYSQVLKKITFIILKDILSFDPHY